MYETKLFLELHPNVVSFALQQRTSHPVMFPKTLETAVVIVLPAATFRHSTFYGRGDYAFVFLVQSSSPPPRFDPRPIRVGFLVDKVALGQVFLPVREFPPCHCRSTSAAWPSLC